MDRKEIQDKLPGLLKEFENYKLEQLIEADELLTDYVIYGEDIDAKIFKQFPSIDDFLAGGVRQGQLETIIGDTNIGKTTTAENLSRISVERNYIKDDEFLLILGMEVTKRDIFEIRCQMEFDMNIYQLEGIFRKKNKDKEYADFIEKARALDKKYENVLHLLYRMRPHELKNYIMAIQKITGKKIKALICDYVGLFRLPGANETERITESMITLKEVGVNFDIPVINFSQRGDTRDRSRKNELNMRSGKGSSEVEFSSNIVGGLKEEKTIPTDWAPDIKEKIENNRYQVLRWEIFKKKHGRKGYADLIFDTHNRRMFEPKKDLPF